MRIARIILPSLMLALPALSRADPTPLQWALNPPHPCVSDSVVLVFRGFRPIWDQGSFYDAFTGQYRDSIARLAQTGPETFVARTVYRPDRYWGPDFTFGVPFGLGRLAAGPHHLTIEHHQLTQAKDEPLDSTVVEQSFDFEVDPDCPPAPEIPMASLPWTSGASLTPAEPCAWRPLVLTLHGLFNNSCPRILLAAARDSAHADVVMRLYPNIRNPGCFDFVPPWNAIIPLGLPGPGRHHIEVAFLQQGLNYFWPPRPPVRYRGVMDVDVPATCGGLPERAPLPYVTGIGTFAAGVCEAGGEPGPGIPLAIRGEFPDGCRHVQSVELLPNPLGLPPPLVRVSIADDRCDGVSCLERSQPWCVQTRLPALPPGKHAVMVQLTFSGCSEVLDRTALDAYVFTVPGSVSAATGEDPVLDADPSPADARALSLSPARPNPSSGSVTARISLGASAWLRAAIYDLTGRRVRDLHDGPAIGGSRDLTWDGRDSRGVVVRDGVYFLRVFALGRTETRRIVRLMGSE